MAKKVVKKVVTTETVDEEGNIKKTIKHQTPKKKKEKSDSPPKKKKMTAKEREELLIENFVGLQHAMTNLSIKFGNLSDNITNLLMVFEEAARNYASGGKTDNEDMLRKINSLLDQNKTIAKGLVLMESKLRGGPEPSYQRPTNRESESNFSKDSFSSSNSSPRPLPSI